MGFGAQILADSLSPGGVRLTTFEVTLPRIVLAEFNTHRAFSRNSASSRAIPVKKMIERVLEDPYIPEVWGSNKKGMQAGEEVPPPRRLDAKRFWLEARDEAVRQAQRLYDIGIHKQTTNRLLEPFMWHTIIVTATEWDNFFHLRNNAMAHPGIATPAAMMQELHEVLEPKKLDHGEWHLPLWDSAVDGERDMDWENRVKVSVGRCARVSYLTHDGKRDLQADIDLPDRLHKGGHMSPFEHVARPATYDDAEMATVKLKDVYTDIHGELFVDPANQWSGNLRGWVQYRKTIPNESDIMGAL